MPELSSVQSVTQTLFQLNVFSIKISPSSKLLPPLDPETFLILISINRKIIKFWRPSYSPHYFCLGLVSLWYSTTVVHGVSAVWSYYILWLLRGHKLSVISDEHRNSTGIELKKLQAWAETKSPGLTTSLPGEKGKMISTTGPLVFKRRYYT